VQCGLRQEEVIAIIERAVKLYYTGFKMPVPSGLNLPPEGQLFHEYYGSFADDEYRRLWLEQPDCRGTDHWVEHFVYEQGGWHPTATTKALEPYGYCSVDRKRLHALKKKYGALLAPTDKKAITAYCQQTSKQFKVRR